MRFDLSADPWATAMIAAVALWMLSFLVLVAASVAGTERRIGGRIMIVSLLAFLGFAVVGTWQRIDEADALARGSASEPPTPLAATTPLEPAEPANAETGPTDESSEGASTKDASTGGSPELSEGTSTGGSTGSSEGTSTGASEDAGTTGTPEEPTGDSTTAEPEPAVAMDLPNVKPLPTDPDKRKWAVLQVLRDTEKVANTPRSCARLDSVSRAWARLEPVGSTPKSRTIARNLEKCRRRLLYSISRRHRNKQVEDRDAFAKGLAEALRKQEGTLFWVSINGKSHTRLRIGSATLDETRAEDLMNKGLRADLERLSFINVVFSDGKQSTAYEFEVTPEGELGLPDMRAVGLGEPLGFPSDG